ncbi:DUF2804 domain-containing protein [Agromyces albus]|uniref:DUF2804 domain-containing protein n=1 Tax=Agromyces albus TaxID=205332 RepID=A0A4Q2L6U8_9MICO|nr:DUF2804 domain-containing protein [Agromyces albus]RXZ73327.1 DUF2804 domain-containing protein [Agromyces albus]
MGDAGTPLTRERELTGRVALCLPNGQLNRESVGWTRHPLHDTSGIGRGRVGRGRNKRWEYWVFTSPTAIASLTIAMLDYVATCEMWVLDRRTLEFVDGGATMPLSRGASLPPSHGAGPATANMPGIEAAIFEEHGSTRIRAASARVTIDVLAERPKGHESLGVVVPWSDRRFQYRVKDVARPARGTVTLDGTSHDLPAGESWAVLDHARGRWPYRMTANWGAASGIERGRRLGLQLAGGASDGTGSTENAVSLDGRLHKLGEELEWRFDPEDWLAPWSIRSRHIDLRFEPFYERSSRTALGVIHSETHQCFGTYRGTVTTDAGEIIPVESLFGWAEFVRNRW